MRIINGMKVFTLEFNEQQMALFSKFLANQEYMERASLIGEINHQIQQQRGGEFATEGARESSLAIVK
jgi:hypothetical protein